MPAGWQPSNEGSQQTSKLKTSSVSVPSQLYTASLRDSISRTHCKRHIPRPCPTNPSNTIRITSAGFLAFGIRPLVRRPCTCAKARADMRKDNGNTSGCHRDGVPRSNRPRLHLGTSEGDLALECLHLSLLL